MSKRKSAHKTGGADCQAPLVSAASFNEANYARIRFDDSIAWTIKDTARRRAPDESSVWRHRIGFAGELSTATYLEVKANWDITNDYVGDGGYDLIHDGRKVEVKTTSKRDDMKLSLSSEEVDQADYFVLAKCTHPSKLVQLVGWATEREVHKFGKKSPNGEIEVTLDHLHTFEPLFLGPDKVRATQQ